MVSQWGQGQWGSESVGDTKDPIDSVGQCSSAYPELRFTILCLRIDV